MTKIEQLQDRYHELAKLERRKFWEMTAAFFDVTARDTGAVLGLEPAATQELHDRANALRAEHRALDEECQRIMAEAFPESGTPPGDA
ncbi:MAG: hypothetical protein ABI440_07440 [Casimicrobiaceae bacterium]